MEDTRASVTDTRAANAPASEVVLTEKKVPEGEPDPALGAPTQPQLTPEQLEALALKNKTIDEFLQSLGSYVIIQFARPDSVIARVIYSDQQPYPPTVIAVLEKVLRDLKLHEEIDSQSDMMEKAAKQAQESLNEKTKSRTVRDRILGRR
jgi:hypothetical protein